MRGESDAQDFWIYDPISYTILVADQGCVCGGGGGGLQVNLPFHVNPFEPACKITVSSIRNSLLFVAIYQTL